jgi:hypothetical protein
MLVVIGYIKTVNQAVDIEKITAMPTTNTDTISNTINLFIDWFPLI